MGSEDVQNSQILRRAHPLPTRLRGALLFAALLTVLGAALPLGAQQYGQWTWRGELGVGQTLYRNFIDQDKVSGYTENRLLLRLGIDGVIIHPTIATFSLDLEAALLRYDGDRLHDRNGLGGRLGLLLLGSSAAPTRLWASSRRYDYVDITAGDPLLLVALPDRVKTFGGRVRIRRGFLKGLQIGGDRADVTYVDRREITTDQREYADWNRTTGRFQHHLRLEHRLMEYGLSRFSTEDLTLTLEENGSLSDAWRLSITGIGIRRRLGLADGSERNLDIARLFNRLDRKVSGRGHTIATLNLGYATNVDGNPRQNHLLRFDQLWQVGGGFDVGPIASATYQRQGEATTRLPRLGIFASWRKASRAVNVLVTAESAIGRLTADDGDASASQDVLSHLVTGSVVVDPWKGFEARFEGQWALNDAGLVGDPDLDLPDLGFNLESLGTFDSVQGRTTLTQLWRSWRFQAYGEWTRRRSRLEFSDLDFDAESWLYRLTLGQRRLEASVEAGRNVVIAKADQEVRFEGATLRWRLAWWAALEGRIRRDLRDLALAPDVETTRSEVALRVQAGLFMLEARAFQTLDETAGGTRRNNRGVIWNIGRRFGGILPIVSGPVRRGVIR